MESQWTGQSQKQQEKIISVFTSAKKARMKHHTLQKSKSDRLLSWVEGFVLCNLWQEEEGTRQKKQHKNKSLQLQFMIC